MIYLYELQWEFNDDCLCLPFWTASAVEADGYGEAPWQAIFQSRQGSADLAAFANSNWTLPGEEIDGEWSEFFETFDGIPIYGNGALDE